MSEKNLLFSAFCFYFSFIFQHFKKNNVAAKSDIEVFMDFQVVLVSHLKYSSSYIRIHKLFLTLSVSLHRNAGLINFLAGVPATIRLTALHYYVYENNCCYHINL